MTQEVTEKRPRRLRKYMKKLTNSELKMVSGGVNTDQDTDGDSFGNTVPFCCESCGTNFDIELGVRVASCPNCGHKHVIDG